MDVPQFIAGRFRIECEIGTGGMGTVYRATQLGLERAVAVKIIKPEFAGDRDVAERFLREARTMAKLRHAHAAMIFDAGNLPDGRHFIIMEFVEGTTLSEALAREGSFSPERAVKIAVEICDVLEEAHELGIIHRDLKPSNIMLNDRGVRVLDFGVAKVLASSTEVTATHASTGSGQIVGTPRYMSPEQCLGQRVGARSDLYSLGVLLYEMLTGRPPFIDALPSAVLVKQATAPPPPLPQLRRDIPRPLAIAVHSLLAKRPEDRPRTAAAARAILEKSLLQPQRIRSEVDPLASTVAAVEKRNSVVFSVAAPLGIVITLGALFFVWANSGKTVQPPTDIARLPAEKISQTQAATRGSFSAKDNREGPIPNANPASTNTVSFHALSSSISPNRARQIVASISHGSIGDVQVLQTGSGAKLAAIHDERTAGTTHFFVMEKRGAAFRVSARGPLDTPDFRHAEWTAERIDADGDGYDEILFTGTEASPEKPGYRLVLYVPHTRETYWLRVEGSGKIGQPLKAIWSPNALTGDGSRYRNVLREKVNASIVKARHR